MTRRERRGGVGILDDPGDGLAVESFAAIWLASMSKNTSPQLSAPTTPFSSMARNCSSREADFNGGRRIISSITEKALSRAAPTGCSRCAARISSYRDFISSSSPGSNGRTCHGSV